MATAPITTAKRAATWGTHALAIVSACGGLAKAPGAWAAQEASPSASIITSLVLIIIRIIAAAVPRSTVITPLPIAGAAAAHDARVLAAAAVTRPRAASLVVIPAPPARGPAQAHRVISAKGRDGSRLLSWCACWGRVATWRRRGARAMGAGRCIPESVLRQSSGVAPAWSEGEGAGQCSPLPSAPNDGRARTAPGHGKRRCSGRAPGTESRELERSVGAWSGRSGRAV